jgi:hypothetical protein
LMHFLSLRMGLDMANKLEDHGCISLFLWSRWTFFLSEFSSL